MRPCVVAHGGVGGRSADSDGCAAAARAGAAALRRGAGALDAAVEAAAVLEDDPRYNAGTGSVLRMDGRTIEMDAAVMDSAGRIGAVAAIRSVRNPVRVARRVLDTPHSLLAGEGATAFAQRCGLKAEVAPTPAARERFERLKAAWSSGRPPDGCRWSRESLARAWNFPAAEGLVCDTVGAVAGDGRGGFAAANSTGGTAWMLLGRVGDSPLPGCGYWAGPAGAVAATGIGEEIIRRLLCRNVYGWLEAGTAPGEACRRGVALFPETVPVGLIAASPAGHGAAHNRDMPLAAEEG